MTAEQVAAVLGLDEDDGSTRVVIMSPEERPLIPRFGTGSLKADERPPPEFL